MYIYIYIYTYIHIYIRIYLYICINFACHVKNAKLLYFGFLLGYM